MTINVVASLTVNPARTADFEQAVARARAQVIRNPACHRYDLQRVRNSEGAYVVLETWESTSALKEHGASDAFKVLSAELTDLVSAPPTVTVHEPVGDQVPLEPTH